MTIKSFLAKPFAAYIQRTIKAEMASALAPLAGPSTRLVIRADAGAPHQAVVRVMEAARLQGLSQITFATRSAAR